MRPLDENRSKEETPRGIIVRRAGMQDIERVAELWVQMMEEHAERDPRFALTETARQDYTSYSRGMLENPDNALFVADEKGDIVGYVLALVFDNPPVFSLKRYGFIGEMSVRKSHRRYGVGRLLWKRVERWFRRKGVSVVQLNVSVYNEAGKAFWKSLGFEDFLEIKWLELSSGDPR